jgi:hypothetical protein
MPKLVASTKQQLDLGLEKGVSSSSSDHQRYTRWNCEETVLFCFDGV